MKAESWEKGQDQLTEAAILSQHKKKKNPRLTQQQQKTQNQCEKISANRRERMFETSGKNARLRDSDLGTWSNRSVQLNA